MFVAIFTRKEFYAVYISLTTIYLFICLFIILLTWIFLLAHCYKKVIQETNEIKEAIQKDIGLKPIEKDVIVLYDGENVEEEDKETYEVILIGRNPQA